MNKEEREEKYKRFKELGLICPVCDSWQVRTTREPQMRKCTKCGEQWKKKK